MGGVVTAEWVGRAEAKNTYTVFFREVSDPAQSGLEKPLYLETLGISEVSHEPENQGS